MKDLIKRIARKKMNQLAITLKNDIQAEIRKTSKSGVFKKRAGYKNVRHETSKPYESPNTDTGLLINSITTQDKGERFRVGTAVGYARALEFGTRHTLPRPFFSKAVLKNKLKGYK